MEREEKKRLLKDRRVHFIDISEADGYARTEQDDIIDKLKRANHFGEAFRYSAFNIKGVYRLLQTGTYRVRGEPEYNVIYCCHVTQDYKGNTSIGSYGHNYDFDLVHYLTITGEGEQDAAFVVFKADSLKEAAPEEYTFKNPDNKQDALVAIYIIENFFDY